MKKISVIVPVYNVAADDKLKHCLESLVAQTVEDMEIILVDDASTDDSLQVCRDFEKAYPDKIRIIALSENKRQGHARNVGLKEATGEWVGFIDSDDFVENDYFEDLITLGEKKGADVVSSDYARVNGYVFDKSDRIVNNTADQTGPMDKEKLKKLLIRPGSMVTKIYKKTLIEENKLDFPEDILYEDNCAGVIWSYYTGHLEHSEKCGYFYVQHPTSTVHMVTEKSFEDRVKSGRRMVEEAKAKHVLDDYFSEVEFRYTEVAYVNTLFSYMASPCKKSLAFIKRLRLEVNEFFPAFMDNEYYKELIGCEERKLIALQKKSDLLFYLYYTLKKFYRNLRKG
ncbi:MAG: glycosyltransferase family 2 protein [Lachnospiraceae bacterium]|nr:glycosyltransferase family 2 protein [Lachnospiraceae bacterium]